MNPALSVSLLLLPALGLALLLMIPGLMEWRRPEDAEPLSIDGLYSKQDGIFADRFRQLAARWWDRPGEIGGGDWVVPPGKVMTEPLLVQNLATGTRAVLLEEAWTRQRLVMGSGGKARALVSDGSLLLQRGCKVQRWIHADGGVELFEGCEIKARITSRESVVMAKGCRSQLISAPSITWHGPHQAMPFEVPTHARTWIRRRPIKETGKNWDIPRQGGAPGSTAFINGDLILDSLADVDFPLVVRGNLYIRRGALIAGDIKAHGDLIVEGSAVVGNLCCGGRLLVGEGSSVQGCLRGDELVWLGDGVVVGRPDRPEAVVGDRILLTGHGVVHGRIRALAGWIAVES